MKIKVNHITVTKATDDTPGDPDIFGSILVNGGSANPGNNGLDIWKSSRDETTEIKHLPWNFAGLGNDLPMIYGIPHVPPYGPPEHVSFEFDITARHRAVPDVPFLYKTIDIKKDQYRDGTHEIVQEGFNHPVHGLDGRFKVGLNFTVWNSENKA